MLVRGCDRVLTASSSSLSDSKVLLISHLTMLTVLRNLWWTRSWVVKISWVVRWGSQWSPLIRIWRHHEIHCDLTVSIFMTISTVSNNSFHFFGAIWVRLCTSLQNASVRLLERPWALLPLLPRSWNRGSVWTTRCPTHTHAVTKVGALTGVCVWGSKTYAHFVKWSYLLLNRKGGKFLMWGLEENNFPRWGRGRKSTVSTFPCDLEGVECTGFTKSHATCTGVKKDNAVLAAWTEVWFVEWGRR